MFNVAKVRFLSNQNLPLAVVNQGIVTKVKGREEHAKLYEYRIPNHLDGKVKVGDLGIVSWKGHGTINPSVVEIVEVANVLDGDYENVDFAWLIGVVDKSAHETRQANEKRIKKLKQLIDAEKKRVADMLDFDQLSRMSPSLAVLVTEYRALTVEVTTSRD